MIETKSLFSQSRAGGGLAGVRQSVPSTREPAHGSSEFGSVGVGGVVRKVLQVAHALPISEQYGSDNAITSRAARIGRPNARSVGTGHHHMARSTLKEGTPGLLALRFVRPQPPHRRCGSTVTQDHILDAGLKSLVSRPLPLFLESPLAHRDIRLLPPEPLGALSRQPRH